MAGICHIQNLEAILDRVRKGERVSDVARDNGILRVTLASLCRRRNLEPGRFKRIPHGRLPTTVEAAYLAGIVDGEGHISAVKTINHGSDYRYWCVGVTNTDSNLGHWLLEFGGTVGMRLRGKYKPVYDWRISVTLDLHRFLTAIEPFLRIKGDKARACIQWCEGKLAR